jgi:predicted XRE-type DNA-binding protein
MTLTAEKKKQLEKKGLKIGSVQDFLNLTDEEMEFIRFRSSLGHAFKAHRKKKNLTQIQAARLLKTSQALVARIEKADPSVSADRIVKGLITFGVKTNQILKF